MSSPLRYDTSQLDGEKMSPVKLPVYPNYRARSSSPIPKGVTRHTPKSKLRYQREPIENDSDEYDDETQTQSKAPRTKTSPSKIQDKNPPSDNVNQEIRLDGPENGNQDATHRFTPNKLLAKHPHGLTAKHEGRRNTIHHISNVKDSLQYTPAPQHTKDQNSTSKIHANTISHISFNSSPRIIGLKKHIEAARKKGAVLTGGIELEMPTNESFGVYSSPTHPPNKRKHRHIKNNAASQHNEDRVDVEFANHSDKENSTARSPNITKSLIPATHTLNSSPSRSHNSSFNGQQVSSPIRSTKAHTQSDTSRIASDNHTLTNQKAAVVDEDDADYGEDNHVAKIAKITTNAQNTDNSSPEQTKLPSRSVVNDEFFSRHDLVGQISSSRENTAGVIAGNDATENNELPHQQRQHYSNIQDESDSEFEEAYAARNDNDPSVSQTMLPTKRIAIDSYHASHINDDHQSSDNDLLSKSGGPHRSSRENLGDAASQVESSPLKNKSDSLNRQHQDRSRLVGSDGQEDDDGDLPTKSANNDINLEDEPTTNFMLSPNSKPYFSIAYIKKIQEMHRQEMKESEKVIDDKNKQILGFCKELASTNDQFLSFEQEIKALKQLNKRYMADEESLSIQLNQLQHELASSTKKLRIKESNYIQLEATADQNQVKIDHLEAAINENNSTLRSYEAKHYSLTGKITELEFQIKSYEYKSKSHHDEIVAKDNEIRTLTEANLDYNNKVEDLLKEKEELLTESSVLTSEISKLKGSAEDLEQESFELKEKNTTLQSNIKFQQDEINNLNTEKLHLSSKFDSIVKEAQTYQEDITKLEHDLKMTKDELISSRDLVLSKDACIESLQKDFDATSQQNEELRIQLTTVLNERDGMISQVKDSHSQIDNLIDEIRQKESFNKGHSVRLEEMTQKLHEKDEIIEHDTEKIEEMVQKLNQKEKSRTSSFNEQKYLNKLEEIKLDYHKELEKRMDEASQILYGEYSKKHDRKVALIKNSHREKLERLINEHRDEMRDYDSIVRKCQVAEAEKEALLKLLEQEKLKREEPWATTSSLAPNNGRNTPTDRRRMPTSSVGSGSYQRKRLSPKKTAGGPVRRKI